MGVPSTMMFRATLFLALATTLFAYRDEQASSGPCCVTCEAPLAKFISVDHGFGHAPFCGETCIDPSKYSRYHFFEKNLTGPWNISNPCAHEYTTDGRFYSV